MEAYRSAHHHTPRQGPFSRLFRLQNAFGPKKRVTKTVTSTNLGRETQFGCLPPTRLHQLLCLLESLWPHLQDHLRPESDPFLSSFFVWQALLFGGARFLSGFFSPFFLIRGGYGPPPVGAPQEIKPQNRPFWSFFALKPFFEKKQTRADTEVRCSVPGGARLSRLDMLILFFSWYFLEEK